MILKRESLFGYFLNMYGQLDTYKNKTDICMVTRHFLIGVVIWLFAVLVGIGSLLVAIDLPLSVLLAYVYNVPLSPFFDIATVAIGILVYGFLTLWSLWQGIKYLGRQTKKAVVSSHIPENENVISFKNAVKEKYKSWKHKYCTVIEIKDE